MTCGTRLDWQVVRPGAGMLSGITFGSEWRDERWCRIVEN